MLGFCRIRVLAVLLVLITVLPTVGVAKKVRQSVNHRHLPYRGVPLMPARDSSSVYSQSLYSEEMSSESAAPRKSINVGFEFGTVGKATQGSDKFLGMQYLVGGRVFTSLPLGASRWILRPSFGYFQRKESEGLVSVTEKNFEFGLAPLYQLNQSGRIRVLAGLLNRLDMVNAAIEVDNVSDSGPFQFRYRVGPGLGIEGRLGQSVVLHLNSEFTVTMASSLKTNVGASLGLSVFVW